MKSNPYIGEGLWHRKEKEEYFLVKSTIFSSSDFVVFKYVKTFDSKMYKGLNKICKCVNNTENEQQIYIFLREKK